LPRKVLHVLNSATGGSALSTLGLIEAFRKQGIRSCAVCHDAGSKSEREALRELTNGEVRFTTLYWWNKKIRVPLWKRPLSELKQLVKTGWRRGAERSVTEFAQSHHVDLIHTNTILTPEGAAAARQLGLPHVWHVRELVGAGMPFPLALSDAALGKYLAANCSQLVANSQATAALLRPWVPANLLRVVLNGIDLQRFHPRTTSAQPDRLVVGMAGNLTSVWKKHPIFVDAAARVDRNLPIEWRFYGHDPSHGGRQSGGSYVDALHAQIARAGLAERFFWPGFVDDPAQLMKQLDILVHPADHESFCRIVVEAMAAGLPVVSVRGGGVAEIVEDGVTGSLAPPDDAAQLAIYIERLARDPQLRMQLGEAGRRRALDNYSLEASAAGMLSVYEQAMQRPLISSLRPAVSSNSQDHLVHAADRPAQ
jgi:glycosyltransferase involved in cell wall biosynthesis